PLNLRMLLLDIAPPGAGSPCLKKSLLILHGFGDLGRRESVCPQLSFAVVQHLFPQWHHETRRVDNECQVWCPRRNLGCKHSTRACPPEPDGVWSDSFLALQEMDCRYRILN